MYNFTARSSEPCLFERNKNVAQARTEFAAALNQIASEKGVEVEVVLDAIKAAALAAYKKDLVLRNEPVPEDFEEYTSEVNPVTGEISILHKEKNVTPPGFARIAASIAKQVILQRLNEAERNAILSEYSTKVGTVMSGAIQRQEGNTFFVDLGRAEGVLPPSEQVQSEIYQQNQRLKFFVKEIREGGRGSEVVVSRSDPGLVKGLFALEVPEIQSGNVEIKAIAREAGSRSKVAAISTQEGIDPVGSLVGQKGVRVQAVISELGEEKIDIIAFSEDPERFIAAALSPAKEVKVRLNEADKVATATVPQSQLSLAIGKGGQNVRLAAKLTGWKIDIEGAEEPEVVEEKSNKDQSDESKEIKTEEAGTGEKKEEPQSGTAPSDDTKTVPAETSEEDMEKTDKKQG
ncbi:MAG: transcription termination factor NusA [Patescibacteria group bacterium]|mgnify:CR=1 FL=1